MMRGIKTLKARLDVHQANAQKLASWLAEQPEISRVYYPGLPDHPGREIHNRQAAGPGGVLSFTARDTKLAHQIMNRVKIPALAVSLGAVESIISYPVTMSHAAIPPKQRQELGITDNLIRYSVGLEDPDDLIADLEQAIRGK